MVICIDGNLANIFSNLNCSAFYSDAYLLRIRKEKKEQIKEFQKIKEYGDAQINLAEKINYKSKTTSRTIELYFEPTSRNYLIE